MVFYQGLKEIVSLESVVLHNKNPSSIEEGLLNTYSNYIFISTIIPTKIKNYRGFKSFLFNLTDK